MPSRTPTTFHSKRMKNDQPSHVVTGVYRFNARTGLLLCAGTVYNAPTTLQKPQESSNSEKKSPVSWDRKKHMERATCRYNESPHKIQFKTPVTLSEDKIIAYYQFRRMERFIRKVFSQYGCMALQDQAIMADPKFRALLAEEQQYIFLDDMTPAESDREEQARDRVRRLEKQDLKQLNKLRERYGNLDDIATNQSDSDSVNDDTGSNTDQEDDHEKDMEALKLFRRMVKMALDADSDDDDDEDEDDEEDVDQDAVCSCLSYIFDVFFWFYVFLLFGVFVGYLTNIITEEMLANFWQLSTLKVREFMPNMSGPLYKFLTPNL